MMDKKSQKAAALCDDIVRNGDVAERAIIAGGPFAARVMDMGTLRALERDTAPLVQFYFRRNRIAQHRIASPKQQVFHLAPGAFISSMCRDDEKRPEVDIGNVIWDSPLPVIRKE